MGMPQKSPIALRKTAQWLIFVLFAVCLALPLSFAQSDETVQPITPQNQFAVPATNGSIAFAMNGSCTNATLDDKVWAFSGLKFSSFSSFLPTVGGMKLSVSAQNCNITITNLNPLNVFPPMGSGILEYTVIGEGAQGFHVYHDSRWLSYSVKIDDMEKTEGQGWNLTSDGWIRVTDATTRVQVVWTARSPSTLKSTDQFDVPSLNGSLSFGGVGTYIFADLENGSWRFQNLALNNIMPSGAPRWALGISARNSTATVSGYLAPFGTMGEGWLNYTVTGVGTQTFNDNLDEQANFPLNHTVYIDGEKALNSSWTESDGWITITGAKANVSVHSEPIIPDWFWNLPPPGPPETAGNSDATVDATQNDFTAPPKSGPIVDPLPFVILGGVVAAAVIMVMLLKQRAKPKKPAAAPRPTATFTDKKRLNRPPIRREPND